MAPLQKSHKWKINEVEIMQTFVADNILFLAPLRPLKYIPPFFVGPIFPLVNNLCCCMAPYCCTSVLRNVPQQQANKSSRNNNNNNTRKVKREIFIKMHTILYSATCLEQQHTANTITIWPTLTLAKAENACTSVWHTERKKRKEAKSHF